MRKKKYLKVLIIIISIIVILSVTITLLKNYMLSKLIDSIVENTVIGNNISEEQDKNDNLLDENNSNKEPNLYLELAVLDILTNKYILIGMDKEEVDRLLGSQQNKDFKNTYNYQGLEIYFRDNKVAGMIINSSKNDTNRYKTSKKIGLGNSKDDIIKLYGESIEKNSGKFLTYAFEEKDNSFIKIREIYKDSEADTTKLFCISYSLFESGKISMILIGDYQFIVNMN